VVALRVTGRPRSSVPVSWISTPVRPVSLASMLPLSLLSAYTRPASWAGGISPKLWPDEVCDRPKGMAVMALGVVPGAVAVPPVVPATVLPFSVPLGWVGSRTA
jgi:hypothetical protein